MSTVEILFFAVCIGFTAAEVVVKWSWVPRFFKRKPFTCMMCMTGWSALGLALNEGYGWQSLLFIPAGLLAGAVTEGLMKRYL